ncbi:hypothetical protein ACRRTK_021239 [Alexandromys fortis]
MAERWKQGRKESEGSGVTPKCEREDRVTPKCEREDGVTPECEREDTVTPECQCKNTVTSECEHENTVTPECERAPPSPSQPAKRAPARPPGPEPRERHSRSGLRQSPGVRRPSGRGGALPGSRKVIVNGERVTSAPNVNNVAIESVGVPGEREPRSAASSPAAAASAAAPRPRTGLRSPPAPRFTRRSSLTARPPPSPPPHASLPSPFPDSGGCERAAM